MTRFTLSSALLVAASLALGLAGCRASEAPSSSGSSASTAPAATGPRRAIRVDGMGYHPATLEVPAGQPVTLVFTRTSDEGCGQQLVFPSLGIRKDLPLDQPVEVSVTPERGELAFTCGMAMYRGSIVAR